MRPLVLLALVACSGAPPEPAPRPVCPGDIIGCSSEVGFIFELYDQNPCMGACRRWADHDLEAAVRFVCAVRRPPSDGIDNVYILGDVLGRMDPEASARVLEAVGDRCPRHVLDRLAKRLKLGFVLDRDWTPVRRAADRIILHKGGSPALYDLVREGD